MDGLTQPINRPANQGVRGRYAPSPTGRLHLGNLRTALLAWLQVRLNNGVLVLRMEDLDLPRVKPGSAETLLADLRWLGLDWDEGGGLGGPHAPYLQSERSAFYVEALQRLKGLGLVFPCYCSRKDIAAAASAPHGRSPIYPGTCRGRELLQEEPGKGVPAWRFRVPPGVISFEDRVLGVYRQDPAQEVGDFVVRRKDHLFAYQLAVVVDDALMGITDVVRGADLLDSTPRQIALFEALGHPTPRFWHVPLMNDETDRRMSKRHGSETLEEKRAQGCDAAAVVGVFAAGLGLVPPGSRLSARELLTHLDLETFRKALAQQTC